MNKGTTWLGYQIIFIYHIKLVTIVDFSLTDIKPPINNILIESCKTKAKCLCNIHCFVSSNYKNSLKCMIKKTDLLFRNKIILIRNIHYQFSIYDIILLPFIITVHYQNSFGAGIRPTKSIISWRWLAKEIWDKSTCNK